MLGSPGSIPISAKMGMSVAPKAWNDSGDSQTWYTMRSPSSPKHEWWSRPGGAAAAVPTASSLRWLSLNWSRVMPFAWK